MAQLQKAWLYQQYGGPEVMDLGQVPVPRPSEGQILVQVKAAALNPVDFKRRKFGIFKNPQPEFPVVLGCDMAGIVVQKGEKASKFNIGDEVYADVHNFHKKLTSVGTLAEYTAVDEDLVALKPSNLSFEEAASLPLALLTAFDAFETAQFRAGQSVFITGGAGGVGSLAIQLARSFYGASQVVTTSSSAKAEFAKSLGADDSVDYSKKDAYLEYSGKFDFLFDCIGDAESFVVAKPKEGGGKIVEIAAHFEDPRSQRILVSPDGSKLDKLRPLIESGKLKPVIDPNSPFSFDRVSEAFRLLESGRAKGKIVVSPISISSP
eukprot:TRINITY_DN76_c0_g1_i5.p1 TRINITY_DN76_c0_g1~~TRINITY_DN76_c0_g1_i5.p1  ORF type:complete len:356 (-),score=8.64 TRINITY_DN76_c0_g1_i5:209-1171(-)